MSEIAAAFRTTVKSVQSLFNWCLMCNQMGISVARVLSCQLVFSIASWCFNYQVPRVQVSYQLTNQVTSATDAPLSGMPYFQYRKWGIGGE